jgi:hypothetical protein
MTSMEITHDDIAAFAEDRVNLPAALARGLISPGR